MKLKYEKGASDKSQNGVLMEDSMSEQMLHPYLARPEDFEALSSMDAAKLTTDVHGIQRTGIKGGQSISPNRYPEPPVRPQARSKPPKKR